MRPTALPPMRGERRQRRYRRADPHRRHAERASGSRRRLQAFVLIEFCERRSLRRQQHLADVLAVLDEMMGRGGFVECEDASDLRFDRALRPQAHELINPAPHPLDLAPHVTEIDAEHPLVGAYQRERIELEPGRLRQRGGHAEESPGLACRRRREAEHSQAAGRREEPIAFLQRVSADRIEDELDASPASDLTRARLEIVVAIVDRLVDAERAQLGVFAGRRGSDDPRPNVLGDLGCGDADAAPAEWTRTVSPAFRAPITTTSCHAVT